MSDANHSDGKRQRRHRECDVNQVLLGNGSQGSAVEGHTPTRSDWFRFHPVSSRSVCLWQRADPIPGPILPPPSPETAAHSLLTFP